MVTCKQGYILQDLDTCMVRSANGLFALRGSSLLDILGLAADVSAWLEAKSSRLKRSPIVDHLG